MSDFLRTPLGKLRTAVHRLGLSATYRPGRQAVHYAIDQGLNYFMYFGFDTQMTRVLRDAVARRREQFVLATGGYNWLLWSSNLRRTLEQRLRQLRTDYIDVFHYFGVTKRKYWTPKIADQLQAIRESGLVRAVAISTHDRKLGAELAAAGALDALMVRYNAAHRGAEQDVFPRLNSANPAVVSFTATRWTALLRRPKGYPGAGRLPNAGECYRFVLTNPSVHVCLCAPRSLEELKANLEAVRRGPLEDNDMEFMRAFGDAVYREYKYFM